MRDGRELIGWGMATETYPAKTMPASALVRFQPGGRIIVASGTQEIGTGKYGADGGRGGRAAGSGDRD